MKIIVGRKFHIDAAHRLPDYPGKCVRMHGHTWKVTVEICGVIGSNHMVMDLHTLKVLVDGLLEPLDHRCINEVLPHLGSPTCEELAQWLYNTLNEGLSQSQLQVYEIKVQEGEGGYAKITAE